MMEQFNLLDQYESEQREERLFRERTEMYNQWLKLPEKTFVKEGTPEREGLADILYKGHCKLYQKALHECEALPPDKYIWLNHCERNYWVLNSHSEVSGEHISVCPFCGAELGNSKGDAVLYKAEPKYWLFHLYYDLPIRERGYQTAEERQKIREVWG